jgi:hypothetical protein
MRYTTPVSSNPSLTSLKIFSVWYRINCVQRQNAVIYHTVNHEYQQAYLCEDGVDNLGVAITDVQTRHVNQTDGFKTISQITLTTKQCYNNHNTHVKSMARHSANTRLQFSTRL